MACTVSRQISAETPEIPAPVGTGAGVRSQVPAGIPVKGTTQH